MDTDTITNVKRKLYTAHCALYGCGVDPKRIAIAMQNIVDAINAIDNIVLQPTTAPPVVVHCDT